MPLRVGILTMHRVVNCGSQLQAYALQRVVEKFGCECEVIDYQYPDIDHYHQKMSRGNCRSFKGLIKLFFSSIGVLRIIQRVNIWRVEQKKKAKLRQGFKGVHLTRHFTRKSIQRNPPKYDVYMTGSDQVWNPNCIVGDYNFLLAFVGDDARKVAYSSSFGVCVLPESCKEDYSRYLKRFDMIGVREPSGVEIVRSLTGKSAQAVLDPTMLLCVDDWRRYARDISPRKGRYVFMYVLSYVFNSSPWIMNYAKKIASLLGCEVVFYGGGEPECEADAQAAGFVVLPHYISPQALVCYYLDAEYVIATGFHGTAFAITLGKHFSAVLNPNPSDDDRVVSLLQRLGYEDRGVLCGSDYSTLTVNWLVSVNQKAKDAYALQCTESRDFLKSALGLS